MLTEYLSDTKKLHKYIVNKISGIYDEGEASNISRILILDLFNLSNTDFLLNKKLNCTQENESRIEEAIKRLQDYEPIQYITGKAYFYNLEFKVDHNVLIPRPETEGLVREIIDLTLSAPQILDIGSGSGCIAISLAKHISRSSVDSIDVDEKALRLAKKNAADLNVKVNFFLIDMLQDPKVKTFYDVIVSNPPYIPEKEKKKMNKNVTRYEPDLALFVPNDNPLIFYERIADFALEHLNDSGYLFFEIHEEMGRKIIELLKKRGFINTDIKKDLQGKDRIAVARTNISRQQ